MINIFCFTIGNKGEFGGDMMIAPPWSFFYHYMRKVNLFSFRLFIPLFHINVPFLNELQIHIIFYMNMK